MEAKRATIKEMDYVLDHLDEESRKEFVRAGYDMQSARAFFVERIERGLADTLRHNGRVVAVIAWVETEGVIYTAFIATSEFFNPKVPSVRFGRRYLRALQQSCGQIPIVARCYSDREQVRRWYELMGFVLISERNVERVFRLDCISRAGG